MRVSFTVRDSVRVIQVAILSCNCEVTQPRRISFANPYPSATGRLICLPRNATNAVECRQSIVYCLMHLGAR